MTTNRLRSVLLLALLTGALTAAAASAAPQAITTAGVKAADAPIVAWFEEKLPTATEVFVNCPKANAIRIEGATGEEPQIPRGRGFQCEVRYLLGGKVVKRQDEVEEWPRHSGEYVLVNVSNPRKGSLTWQDCEYAGSPGFRSFDRVRLLLRGQACGYVTSLALLAIEDKAYRSKGDSFFAAKVPPTFSVGDEGEYEVGFRVERFLCHATTRPAGRSRVRHLVSCGNSFGDGIRVTLETPLPGTKLD